MTEKSTPATPPRGVIPGAGPGMENEKKSAAKPPEISPTHAHVRVYIQSGQQHAATIKSKIQNPALFPAGEGVEAAQQRRQPEHLHPQQKQQTSRGREPHQQIRPRQQRQQLPPGEARGHTQHQPPT